MPRPELPVIVVGAGLAGLVTALELAPLPVLLLARQAPGRGGASLWAQGGIAAAMEDEDSSEQHARDTIAAGDGLCDPDAVAAITGAAGDAIAWLEDRGVCFDRDAAGRLLLGREGGHGRRRVLHVRDATGDALLRRLAAVLATTPSVRFLEAEAASLAVEDGRVCGIVARRGGEMLRLPARAVVLATGGAGALYAETSNPLGARGDGLVLAARAGALLADLEFLQFHPTAIDVGLDPMPLATEALRGEGARLIDAAGHPLMDGEHPLGDLAPRDVVARAIWRARSAGRRVFLDLRFRPGRELPERFPTVHAACVAAGIDPLHEPVPVAPAAHYHMGGIATDLDGRSSVPGLWVVGEAAATGLHGANRLASNSLLEGLVCGLRAARAIGSATAAAAAPRTLVEYTRAAGDDDPAALARLRAAMSAGVGVERDGQGLAAAIRELQAVRSASGTDSAAGSAATAGILIATAAWLRRESRGGHYRRDFPLAPAGAGRRYFLTLDEIEAQAATLAPDAAPHAVAC